MLAPGLSLISADGASPVQFGTLGCLLVPKGGAPDGRVYALSCAHVLSPPGLSIQPGDPIVDVQGDRIGRLEAATDPLQDGVDAAVALLEVPVAPTLGVFGVPVGYTFTVWDDSELRAIGGSGPGLMRLPVEATRQPIGFTAALPSGAVAHFRLENQIVAVMDQNRPVATGDSGSVVLNELGLVAGMVVGVHPGSPPNQRRAVITPLRDVLVALERRLGFALEPLVSRMPTLPSAPPPAAQALPAPSDPPWPDAVLAMKPAAPDSAQAEDVLARTLWGEAAVDWRRATWPDGSPLGDVAYRAVAEVIVNRVRARRSHWGGDVAAVCQKNNGTTWQFDCWNAKAGGGARLQRLRDVQPKDPAFAAALVIARHTLAGWTGNLTGGARHFYNPAVADAAWARGHTPSAIYGGHHFFNDVA
jgi:N-acetylmuramoyl-L-alanine amidase